jgi:hypothetical protein
VAGVGELQAPTHPQEQGCAKAVFKRGDLAAQGLRRQAQLLGGGAQAAGARDGPELLQLAVIDRFYNCP